MNWQCLSICLKPGITAMQRRFSGALLSSKPENEILKLGIFDLCGITALRFLSAALMLASSRDCGLMSVFWGRSRGSCSSRSSRGGVVQKPKASDHPSLSTPHAVKLHREDQADFRNDNGSTGSRTTRSKGPHLRPCGQIGHQSSEQGHREVQSGDTLVTYRSVRSRQRHPFPQPSVLNIKAPLQVTGNSIPTLLSCVIKYFELLPTC